MAQIQISKNENNQNLMTNSNINFISSDVNFATDDLAKGTIPTLRLNIPIDSLKYLNDFHTLYQNVHIATADISSNSLGEFL